MLAPTGQILTFTKDVEAFLVDYVEAGQYATPQEVIRQIVRTAYQKHARRLKAPPEVPDLSPKRYHIRFPEELETFLAAYANAHAFSSKQETVKHLVREFYLQHRPRSSRA
jgi:Arc/MetJ-type ribon-helix-helix transcriptional regulator